MRVALISGQSLESAVTAAGLSCGALAHALRAAGHDASINGDTQDCANADLLHVFGPALRDHLVDLAMARGIPILVQWWQGLPRLDHATVTRLARCDRVVVDSATTLLDLQRLGVPAARLTADVEIRSSWAEEMVGLYAVVAGNPARTRRHRGRIASLRASGASRPYATVLIPTFNGGGLLTRVLDVVQSQQTSFPFEVICIDSGSRDGTREHLQRRAGLRFLEVEPRDFNHGSTRDLGIAEAEGEVVALLSQDAEPANDTWLQAMVEPFDDPEVAGVACVQVPRNDCNPFQRDRMEGVGVTDGRPLRRQLRRGQSWDALTPADRMTLLYFDNAASTIRRSVVRETPFGQCGFGEDDVWASRVIKAGHALVTEPRARAIHSHNRSVLYEFRRVYLNHKIFHEIAGLHCVPRVQDVARFTLDLGRRLRRRVWQEDGALWNKLWWMSKIPAYAFTQNLAQYLGARSARGQMPPWWYRVEHRIAHGI